MKSRKPDVFVSPRPGGNWAVQRTHSERAVAVHERKADAVEQARDIARNDRVELVIQRSDGRIHEKNTYGVDRFPPKG